MVAESLDNAFWLLQGENWSPNGEARDFIREKGTDHTSMSVGDILFDPDTLTSHFCCSIGWVPFETLGVLPS